MTNKILKEKKKTILFLSVFILFTTTLAGCNWFGEGILNVFDPKAQIRVNISELDAKKDTIELEVYSINQVEFNIESFDYRYHSDGVLIPDLSKTVGTSYYVAPSNTPGVAGAITKIPLTLYHKDVKTYLISNLLEIDISCTIVLIGVDGAGHKIMKPVTFDLPVEYFPEVTIILSAEPTTFVINGGISTITAFVVDDKYGRPLNGLNIIFTSNGGTLSSTSGTTDSNGMVTFTLTVPDNNAKEDMKYDVGAHFGKESGSVTITVKGTGKEEE